MVLAPISRGGVVDRTDFYPLIYGCVKGYPAQSPGSCQPYSTNLDVEMAILPVLRTRCFSYATLLGLSSRYLGITSGVEGSTHLQL